MSVYLKQQHATAAPRNGSNAHRPGAYDTLLSRLPVAPDGRPLRMIGVTSVGPGEGVSTVARGLALAAIDRGESALLIDLNGCSASCRDASGEGRTNGRSVGNLTDAIAGRVEITAALEHASVEGLMLLSAGADSLDRLNDDELHQLDKVLADLRQQFEWIAIDLPSVSRSSAAMLVGELLDGVLLVVQAERVERGPARRVLQQLQRSGARVVGAVLNHQPEHLPAWLQRRH